MSLLKPSAVVSDYNLSKLLSNLRDVVLSYFDLMVGNLETDLIANKRALIHLAFDPRFTERVSKGTVVNIRLDTNRVSIVRSETDSLFNDLSVSDISFFGDHELPDQEAIKEWSLYAAQKFIDCYTFDRYNQVYRFFYTGEGSTQRLKKSSVDELAETLLVFFTRCLIVVHRSELAVQPHKATHDYGTFKISASPIKTPNLRLVSNETAKTTPTFDA